MSLNRVIGAQGKIPWRLSEDLKFFKRTTLGHVILMGRKTYESLGKPLPGRENWVVSSRSIPGVRVIHDLREIAEPGGGRELFLIGGAQLYGELLQKCSELFLTLVKREVAGDTFFPPFESTFRLEEVVFESLEMEIRRYGRLPGRQAIWKFISAFCSILARPKLPNFRQVVPAKQLVVGAMPSVRPALKIEQDLPSSVRQTAN